MKKFLSLLSGLFLITSADARGLHGGIASAVAPSNVLMAAATNIWFPTGTTGAVDTNHQFFVTRTPFCVPHWSGNSSHDFKIGVANFYLATDGSAPDELLTGNAETIEKVSIEYAGAITDATQNGTPVLIAQGATNYWDVPVTMAADSCGFVRMSGFVSVGQALSGNQSIRSKNATSYGAGAIFASTTQAALVDVTGAISFSGAGGSYARVPQPSVIVAQGWDGVTPVGLITGDSNSTSEGMWLGSARIIGCAICAALDDSGARYSFATWGAPGQNASAESQPANIQYRLAAFKQLPQPPWTFVIDEHGENGPMVSLANIEGVFYNNNPNWHNSKANHGTIKTYMGNPPIFKITFTPKTTDVANTAYTSVDQQSIKSPPAGACVTGGQQQWFTNFDAGMYDSYYSGKVNVLGDVTAAQTGQPCKAVWNHPVYSTTLAVATTSGGTSFVVNGACPVAANSGFTIVVDPGLTANISFDVVNATDNGDGTCTITSRFGQGTGTHSIGATILGAYVGDGTHFNNAAGQSIASKIIPHKNTTEMPATLLSW